MRKPMDIKFLCQWLKENYPDAHCALHYETPFQLLIATILSAQCTDVRVNQVTAVLFAKYPGPQDLAALDLNVLESLIRPTGFFKNKARNIQLTSRLICERHGGEVPRDMDALIQLPGVGRKTANVVLGNAFGLTSGLVVDTHVMRLSRRWKLTRSQEAESIERDLMKLVPRKDWIQFSHWLIFHGRQVCKARRPLCERCGLSKVCPAKENLLTRVK